MSSVLPAQNASYPDPQSDAPGIYSSGLPGIAREWDGEAWTDTAYLDARIAPLQPWGKGLLGFFASKLFWWWVACFVASVVLTIVFVVTRNDLYVIASGLIGPAGTLLAFYTMFSSRIGFGKVISRKALLGWGLLGGVVGFAFALPIELQLNTWLGVADNSLEGFIFTGPIEETAKLLIPLLLYIFGRYRSPRAGFAIALASATAFGWIEGIEYVAGLAVESTRLAQTTSTEIADAYDVVTTMSRPFVELLHPVLTGFVAAVAWRSGWLHKRFWRTLLGAWLIASVLHSVNDMSTAKGAISLVIFPVIILVGFFALELQRARQFPPPSRIGFISPHWRPTLNRKITSKLQAAPNG